MRKHLLLRKHLLIADQARLFAEGCGENYGRAMRNLIALLLLLLTACSKAQVAPQPAAPRAPSPQQVIAIIEKDHQALNAFMAGDPGPKKALYSRRDDVTLANPLGPPAKGWTAVSKRLEEAASSLRGARGVTFERITLVVTPDLAYSVELEHYQEQLMVGSDTPHPVDLRVTTVFRLEDQGWRIVHRHADPIVTRRGIESIIRRDEP